jgi:hypothetical protein
VWRAGSWCGAESKVACRRGSGTRNTHITRNLLKRLPFSIRFLLSTICTSSYSALHCSYLLGKPQVPMSVGSCFLYEGHSSFSYVPPVRAMTACMTYSHPLCEHNKDEFWGFLQSVTISAVHLLHSQAPTTTTYPELMEFHKVPLRLPTFRANAYNFHIYSDQELLSAATQHKPPRIILYLWALVCPSSSRSTYVSATSQSVYIH